MAFQDIVEYNPLGMDFLRWARLLVEALAEYNVPNPVSEDLWVQWATNFVAVPEIAQLGVPDPRTFGDWKTWAANVTQVLG
jgi:hypothetical protein